MPKKAKPTITPENEPPRRIVPIPNIEKKGFEKWKPNQDIFNFPRPYRHLIVGTPNAGKTTMILNTMLHAQPPFDRIFIIHPRIYQPETTDETNESVLATDQIEGLIPEYSGVLMYHLRSFPTEKFFEDMPGKTLMIVDDVDILSFVRGDSSKQRRINKLYSYVSSHNNVSVITTSQSPSSQLPSIVFQMSNIITLYKIVDQYKLRTISQKLGIEYKSLKEYQSKLGGVHDAMTLDYTVNSPAPVRKNIYESLS